MRNMANLGKAFERTIEMVNEQYLAKQIANVQKISTPWNVVRIGTRIVKAYPSGKSTLDFRGTLLGGQSISFDCKETDKETLPLANFEPHQIEYIRTALNFGEWSFILTHLTKTDKYYYIPGAVVLDYWDIWQKNKKRRGFNSINIQDMIQIRSREGIYLDYLEPIYN
jgi:recombination protein U